MPIFYECERIILLLFILTVLWKQLIDFDINISQKLLYCIIESLKQKVLNSVLFFLQLIFDGIIPHV